MEQLENEARPPATPERKGNSTELLESDKQKSNWEGNGDIGIATLGT